MKLFLPSSRLLGWERKGGTMSPSSMQQQVESQIKKQEEKKKELKKKKEYIKTKEFIEKTATEKFGLLYPGEYLLKGSDD